MSWEIVIGLEVHAQLATRTKMFCPCEYRYGTEPNRSVCPTCLGLPGALPVVNRQAVLLGVRAALALDCQVHRTSRFARKNYFYPDLAKGYQISQQEHPLATGGALEIPTPDGPTRRIGLIRAHLEEDAGKSEHIQGRTRVDFNRCGVPLLEIVSRPELTSPAEARSYLTTLRALLRRLDVCHGDLETGSLRCDANLSVRRIGEEGLRTRSELKNLNSFRFLEQALSFEARRHIDLYEAGGEPVQETRLYDPAARRTRPMRSKEQAEDYRYFPEPDLPPLVISSEQIEKIRQELPELPLAHRGRLERQHGLPTHEATLLSTDPTLADLFEATVREGAEPGAAAGWITGELLRRSREADRSPADWDLSPTHLRELIQLVEDGLLSVTAAKSVLPTMLETGRSPTVIAREKNLVQIRDSHRLRQLVREILSEHPEEVAAYRSGRTKLLGFFMGRAMEASGGQGDPRLLSRLVREELEG